MRKAVLGSILSAISIACTGCSSSGSDGGTGGPTTALSFDADTALPATSGAAVATTFATQFGAVLSGVFSALSGGGSQLSIAPKIDIPIPGFCSGGGTAILDWNGSDLAAGDTVILTLDSCAGSPVSSGPASGTITLDMESVSGVLPIIGGIITATATLALSIGDSQEDTITGSFAVDANLPNFTLANLTFGDRAESDEIIVTEGGQELRIQCFDIFQRIGLAGPGIEFFRPLAVVRLGNEDFTMNDYEDTPDNISFDFSTGAAVPIRGTINLFSGIGAGVPCFNGVPEGDGSSSSATFNPGGCVDIRGVDSEGVGFGFSTFWDDLLDLDSSGGVSEEFCDGGGTGGTGGVPTTGATPGPMDCDPGSDVFAAADAYIRGDGPEGNNSDTPHGNAGNLLIKSVANMFFTRKMYIVFDLSSFSDSFTKASLVLTLQRHVENPDPAKSGPQPVNVFGINDDNDWDPADPGLGEDEITWNNAPRNVTAPPSQAQFEQSQGVPLLIPGYDFDLPPVGAIDPGPDSDPPGVTKYALDITEYVTERLQNGDGKITILMAASNPMNLNEDGSAFFSLQALEECDRPFLHFE